MQKELTEKLLQKHRLKKTKNNHLRRNQKMSKTKEILARAEKMGLTKGLVPEKTDVLSIIMDIEGAVEFFNIDEETHFLALLALLPSVRKSRRSSMLTASSTTVEMAILTRTHFVTSTSLFVCQS